MNKTKKELLQEIDDLMRIIAFYIDGDILIDGHEVVLKKIKKRAKLNNMLCRTIYILASLLLCVAFYLIGLGR